MSRKIAIVTGSSSGFGRLSVIELAKNNFHVVATMRDMSKADSLVSFAKNHGLIGRIDVFPLDVTSPSSLSVFNSYISKLPSIDLLVNNAGIAIGGFCEELTIDDYRQQFETNFFGVVQVTQLVLPYMRKQQQGRIINISSISGLIGFPGLSPYTASKHALEGFSESLRLEVQRFGIDIVLIEPGSYETNIWSGMDRVKQTKDSPYNHYVTILKNKIEAGKANHGSPQEVAKLVSRIALEANTPRLRYPIGKGVRLNSWIKKLLPWRIIETFILKTLR